MLVLPYPVEDPTTQARIEERYAWWLSHRNAPAILDDDDRRRYNLGLTYVDYPRLQAITDYLVGEILSPANDKRAFMIEGPPLSGKTSLVCEVAMRVIHEVRAHEGEYAEAAGVRSRIMTVNYFRGSVGEGASLMRNVLDSLDNPPAAHGRSRCFKPATSRSS